MTKELFFYVLLIVNERFVEEISVDSYLPKCIIINSLSIYKIIKGDVPEPING
jgi:hypothetical protein